MKFRNEGNSEDILVFNNSTKIVDKDSLKKVEQPVWVEHGIPNKTGNISHFTGTGDAGMPFVIWLYGANKLTNLQTLMNLAVNGTIIYLNADDFDSNLSGKYRLVAPVKRDDDVSIGLIKFTCNLKEYNN